MGMQFDFEDVPDSVTVPEGVYDVEVATLEEARSQEGSKLMFKVGYRVVGGDYEGMPIRDNFVLGTDKDPDCQETPTKKRFGAVRWKQFVKACQAPLLSDVDELFAALQGQRLTVQVNLTEDQKYGPQNNVKRYLPYGTQAAA